MNRMIREVAIVRKALYLAAVAAALSIVFALSGSAAAWFSRNISLPLSSVIARATSITDWPVGEVLLIFAVPAVIALIGWAAIRRRAPREVAFALSLVFLMYAVLWVPQCFAPAKETENYETWRLVNLTEVLATRAEELRGDAYAAPDASKAEILAAARDAVAALEISERPMYAPKLSRFPKVLQALKIGGLYAPWTGEAIISPKEPLFTLPFLATHELAHAAGIAREDEANFAAYRACMTGDARFQYAGTIYALRYAMDALRAVDMSKWLEIRMALDEGVRYDFTRIDDPGDASGTAAFADRAAEAFLQLSGQRAGLASYAGMVNFLLSDVSLVDDPQTLQREEAVQYIN